MRTIATFICCVFVLIALGDILITNYALHLPTIPQYTTIHTLAVCAWTVCTLSWLFLLYHNIKHNRSCCASCLVDANNNCQYGEHDE